MRAGLRVVFVPSRWAVPQPVIANSFPNAFDFSALTFKSRVPAKFWSLTRYRSGTAGKVEL
jgi:hypothetical protein